jgi:hypothetical protein
MRLVTLLAAAAVVTASLFVSVAVRPSASNSVSARDQSGDPPPRPVPWQTPRLG